ncbi:13098_t:CDS:2 [Cetraspora pellucida]|uniref:13098_t:CDS:1 n=1 Tax=Cetraspora pellucida TaxID=1433469 RepID=A0A9N8W242_9GLOM|nr:13098_t:CDS:2 [Cetraspora pellucida]
MSDTRLKINSLKELNSKLLPKIFELRKENAEVKTENTKLKQAIKANAELKTRFEVLEKKNKTDTSNLIAKNAELRDRVTKLYTYLSEPKSFENKKIDEFLDLKSKERNLVSDTSISPEQNYPTKSQCIEQELTKELQSSRVIISPVSTNITEHQSSQITTQSLICLFQNAI